jgi:hypothetical protein
MSSAPKNPLVILNKSYVFDVFVVVDDKWNQNIHMHPYANHMVYATSMK